MSDKQSPEGILGSPREPSEAGRAGEGGARERDEECPAGRSESERTLQRRVSRETLTPEEQMLNDIMDRAMNPAPDLPETEERPAEAEDVSRETPGEKKPTPSPAQAGRNQPSSAYIYLAILFGAAFLMLLLAYFVQQRNNANVQDELRTTTASRQELLDDIEALEEEKEQLQDVIKSLGDELKSLTNDKESLQQVNDLLLDDCNAICAWHHRDFSLSCLEKFLDGGDYLMAAVLVEDLDGNFNRHHKYFDGDYLFPSQAARYLELREDLLRKCGYLQLNQLPTEDGSDYIERPLIDEDTVDPDVLDTAWFLWTILVMSHLDPNVTAGHIEEFCDRGDLERLNSGAFQPVTVAMFEQTKSDLLELGYLAEMDDGRLTTDVRAFLPLERIAIFDHGNAPE